MLWQRMLDRLAGSKTKLQRTKKRRLLVESLARRELLAVDFGAVGGVAFTDNANDGLTADDVRLENVQVQLFNDVNTNGTFEAGTDTLVNSTTTGTGANAGNYRFDGLSAGQYLVVQGFVAGQTIPDPVAVNVSNATGVRVAAIDTYETATAPVAADSGTPVVTAFTAAAEAIGGERDVQVTHSSGTSDVELEVDAVGDTLTVSTGAGTSGTALLQYDGLDSAITLNPTGLNANLSAGDSAAGIEISVTGDNPGGILTIRAYTNGADFSTVDVSIPDTGVAEMIFVPFNTFTVGGGSGADFTNIGAIEASIATVANLDTTVTIIESLRPDLVTANLPNIQTLTLGGILFADNNAGAQQNNGVLDAGEAGLAGATVQLFRRDPTSGSLDPTSDPVFATTTAGADGRYSFPDLVPNEYQVVIPDSQFASGAALFGFINSTGNDPAPNTDLNADDVDDGRTLAGVGIASGVIQLVANDEPTNDDDTDPNTNTTVDFGFVPQMNLSITKTLNAGLSSQTPGGNAIFDIVVENAGPLDATGVTVADVVPAGLTFNAATSDFGTFTNTGSGNNVNVVIGNLDVGNTATFRLGTIIGASQTADITNTATVTGDQLETDTNDNSDDAVVDLTEADLSITKTDNTDPVNAGNQLTYTIQVTNNGPDSATDVRVTDNLPADVTFATSSGDGTVVENPVGSGNLEISLGTLTNGQTVSTNITVNVAPDAASPLNNNASVVANPNNDSNMANNSTDEPTVVERAVDVAIDKTVSGTALAGGSTPLTYTIAVTNNGPSEARDVEVTDTLDSRLAFVGLVGTPGVTVSQVGQDLTFDVGTLAPNQSLQFSFEASVLSSATGVIPNTGTVSTSDNDTVPTNNEDTVQVTVENQIDLVITKDVDRATAVPGQDQLVYTIVVSHDTDSPSDATNVVVTDVLPAGVAGAVISAPTATSTNFDNASQTATVTFDSLPVGETRTFTITVDINQDATGTLTNPASVAATETELDTTNNNDDAVTTLTPQFDVTIDKTVSDATPGPGDNVTYTIDVVNTGPSQATQVVLTDSVPAGLTFVSGTLDGVNATGTSPVTFGAITLDANQTATATLVFSVDASADGQIVNTASVTADGNETNTNNNDDTATITVTPVVDISVVKTVDQTVAQAGSTLQYSMTVTNTGPSTAANVQAVDTLPPGVTFVSGSGPNGETLSLSNGTVTVNGGDLAPNASFTFTINATVNSGITTDQTNSVTVSTSTNETNTGNNTATAQTRIDPVTGSLAGTVYVDANNNAQQDNGETGIAGVTLTLTGTDSVGNNVSRTTTTDANGDYIFANLAEGTYQVEETQPAGFRDGRESPGTGANSSNTLDDMFTEIGLDANAQAVDFDFGELNEALSKRRFLASS